MNDEKNGGDSNEIMLDIRSGPKTLERHYEARKRYEVIMDCLGGRLERQRAIDILQVSRSHFQRLLAKCRGAVNYKALVKEKSGRKFGSLRGRSDTLSLIEEMFKKHFPSTRTFAGVWAACQTEADVRKMPRPSYHLVKRWIRSQDSTLIFKLKNGEDAAKQKLDLRDGYKKTVRALEWVQIDHTPMDLLVVDEDDRTQVLGRPYISLAICLHTRAILGFYISLLPPSAVSVAMLMETIVLPKNDLLKGWGLPEDLWPMYGKPEVIHSDNAKEFVSDVFVLNAKSFDITVLHRAIGRKHEGGHIESLIGKQMLHTVHQLPGATGSNTLQRKKMNSEAKACFTLSGLRQAMVYRIKAYHETKHSSLGRSPREAWESDFSGSFHSRELPENEHNTFKYTFYPEVPKKKKVAPEGIEMFRRFYSGPLLKGLVSEELDVKYDPYDLSYILVKIEGEWKKVNCKRNRFNKSSDFEMYRWQRQQRGDRDGTMSPDGARALGEFHKTSAKEQKATRSEKQIRKRQKGKEDYRKEQIKRSKSPDSAKPGVPITRRSESKGMPVSAYKNNVFSFTGGMNAVSEASDEFDMPLIYETSSP